MLIRIKFHSESMLKQVPNSTLTFGVDHIEHGVVTARHSLKNLPKRQEKFLRSHTMYS